MVGTCIGSYRIVREVAQDSVGQVFEALDLTRKKKVALKYLWPETAGQPYTVPRLYSEAKTLARLNHPNIARLYGFIRCEQRLYLVMEFVEGKSLAALMEKEGRLQPNRALALFRQIASAVEFAHRLGVIHGDLRPSNIMLTPLGVVKVLDFAIAPIVGLARHGVPSGNKACYASPEQLRGDPGDIRSDIYSLGIVLYQTITGRVPFEFDSNERILKAQLESSPLPPSLVVPGSPPWLDDLVQRALAPSPSDRFPSTSGLLRSIESAEQGRVLRARRARGRVRLRRGYRRIIGSASMGAASIAASALALARNSARAAARSSFWLGRASSEIVPAARACGSAGACHADRLARLARVAAAAARGRMAKSVIPRSAGVWKKYACVGCALVVVSLEIFYFHGANMRLMLSLNPTPRASLSDAVDQMLAQMKKSESRHKPTHLTQAQSPGDHPHAAPTQAPDEERTGSAGPRMRRARDEGPPLRGMRRAASTEPGPQTEREPNPLSRPPVAVFISPGKQPPARDPVPQREHAQSRPPKTQLNVKWEN